MCVFCEIIAGNIPGYKVYEDETVIAILDIAQVTFGHTMVIPKKHVADITEVDKETLQHIISVVQDLAIYLKDKCNAKGVNVLNNNGEAAGQTVSHLHFHIIPRYDENDAIVAEFKESGIDVAKVAEFLGL